MYHLITGLYAQLTRKDEYSVVIIGLDNVRRSQINSGRALSEAPDRRQDFVSHRLLRPARQ
jgi:hypothetical protein